jgi:hypothetical protein
VNLEVDLLARYLERLLLGEKAAEPAPVTSPKVFWPPTATSNPDVRGCRVALNSIEELVEDIRQGKMVILMDDEDRENEGDLIMAAELLPTEHINFMARTPVA